MTAVTRSPVLALTEAGRRWGCDAELLAGSGRSGDAGARTRVVGMVLTSATARSAPWEAATALHDVRATRPEVLVELLSSDRRAVEVLRDHPLLGEDGVRLLDRADMDQADVHTWLDGLDLLLLPARRAGRSTWSALCAERGVDVVTVEGVAVAGLSRPAAYPSGPHGLVDADDVARAIVAALDAVHDDDGSPTGAGGRGRRGRRALS